MFDDHIIKAMRIFTGLLLVFAPLGCSGFAPITTRSKQRLLSQHTLHGSTALPPKNDTSPATNAQLEFSAHDTKNETLVNAIKQGIL